MFRVLNFSWAAFLGVSFRAVFFSNKFQGFVLGVLLKLLGSENFGAVGCRLQTIYAALSISLILVWCPPIQAKSGSIVIIHHFLQFSLSKFLRFYFFLLTFLGIMVLGSYAFNSLIFTKTLISFQTSHMKKEPLLLCSTAPFDSSTMEIHFSLLFGC